MSKTTDTAPPPKHSRNRNWLPCFVAIADATNFKSKVARALFMVEIAPNSETWRGILP